ncbi:MAG: hypothetical protein PUB17_03440 [Lachnospiraceae bacterium]|nr:hypothetical protein [Lachnospiraceae bacterium]
MSNDKYRKAYNMVVEYEKEAHRKNQKRIAVGLKLIIIIPLIFLALLLFTGSSKVIFLILWIVSLFILAAYLITVEYMDYNLMERMAKLRGQDDDMEDYDLIGNEAIESRIRDVLDKIDGTEAGHEEHN